MNAKSEMLLLVEDNRDDVFFLQRALRKANVSAPVQVAPNGQAAIDYLKAVMKDSDPAQYPRPSLVLLDLKVPYVSGFEVLKWIREQPALADLSVVVLTSSPEERDREMAMTLRASGYLVKPPTEAMLRELLIPAGIAPVPHLTPGNPVMAEMQQPPG
jgi:CheY-like chemotaxis protein